MRITADTKIIVPLKGATVDLITDDTGEVVAALPLTGGIHNGRSLMQYQTDGMQFSFPSSVSVIEPPSRVVVVKNDDHMSSAVRDGYKPSEATLASIAMANMLRRHEARMRRLVKEEMVAGGRQAARQARQDASDLESDTGLVEVVEDAPDAPKAAG